MRARRLNTQKPRSQKEYVNKNGLVPLTLYFKPIVKERIQRYASEQGISVSKAAAALIQTALQEEIIRGQIELIKPVIEKTIAREMQEANEILDMLEDRLFPKKSMRQKN